MTRAEYEESAAFMTSIGVECPPAHDLLRGGIIGTVDIVTVVRTHPSPWFFGPCGIVLASPAAVDIISATGALGLFDWKEIEGGCPVPPAKWMLSPDADRQEAILL
jgi:hypothetical protein